MTESKQDKVIDENISQNLNDKQSIIQNKQQLIQNMHAAQKQLEKEHETVVNTAAKFAHFLQDNAITAYHDSYKAYIQYLIDQ